MSSWWERATTEQRIAQIKGGIECGMNSRQIAVNCRVEDKKVSNFASYNGIEIPRVYGATANEAKAVRHGKRFVREYGLGDNDALVAFDLFGKPRGSTEIFSFEGV